ncbi:hypothetical protein HDU76_001712 [Blyttiomyces sp. JEL0837]|nr:hypothetical protein HDU76_001712 [Blyttiomyces sp. JEL0837]
MATTETVTTITPQETTTTTTTTPASIASEQLHHTATRLAEIMSNLAAIDPTAAPFSNGMDVLIAEMILLSGKVRDENAELLEKSKNLEKAKDDAESEVRALQGMVEAGRSSVNLARDAVANFETDIEGKSTEIEILKRENRNLKRERNEYEKRLYTELATWEKIKAEWALKEEQRMEAMKKIARERRSNVIESIQLATENVVIDAQDSDAAKALKMELQLRAEQLSTLVETVREVESSNIELTARLAEVLEDLESLRSEYRELEDQNRTLMEDAESYQVLLHERTLNGEFMSQASIMQSVVDSVAGRTSISGTTAGRGSLDFGNGGRGSLDLERFAIGRPSLSEELEAPRLSKEDREKNLTEQVKALTLYIQKILNKVMVDERLAAVLVQPDSQPTPPPSPHAPTTKRQSISSPRLSLSLFSSAARPPPPPPPSVVVAGPTSPSANGAMPDLAEDNNGDDDYDKGVFRSFVRRLSSAFSYGNGASHPAAHPAHVPSPVVESADPLEAAGEAVVVADGAGSGDVAVAAEAEKVEKVEA